MYIHLRTYGPSLSAAPKRWIRIAIIARGEDRRHGAVRARKGERLRHQSVCTTQVGPADGAARRPTQHRKRASCGLLRGPPSRWGLCVAWPQERVASKRRAGAEGRVRARSAHDRGSKHGRAKQAH
eukprot:7061346-Prymnesium_polylepis.1